MTRTVWAGNLRTGKFIAQIPAASASWSMVHRGPGDVGVDVPLSAPDVADLVAYTAGIFPSPTLYPGTFYPTQPVTVWQPTGALRPEFLSALTPARCFLAVIEDDKVLEAGPIWTWGYQYGSNVLSVRAAGLWSLFDHRFVMGVLSSGWAAWTQTYGSLSLGTEAKRLVQLAETHTGGDLPIVYPADEASTRTRTWNGYDLATVRSRLDQLMNVEDGPDIAFQPRLTADRLGIEWEMRTGTVADPLLHQWSGDHMFDTRPPKAAISGISVTRDASGMANRSWVTGSGMETSLLMHAAEDSTLVTAGWPLLERSEARGSEELLTTVVARANGNLIGQARPMTTWEFTVQSGQPGIPALGSFLPGDFASVWVPEDHPLLSLLATVGRRRVRLMNVSGDLNPTVKVTCMPGLELR